MQRGVFVGVLLQELAREKGLNQAALEELTGIGHSTMSGYWSDRLPLGGQNAPKIATALSVDVALLQPDGAPDPRQLHSLLEALGDEAGPGVVKALQLLAERVELLERQVAGVVRRATE